MERVTTFQLLVESLLSILQPLITNTHQAVQYIWHFFDLNCGFQPWLIQRRHRSLFNSSKPSGFCSDHQHRPVFVSTLDKGGNQFQNTFIYLFCSSYLDPGRVSCHCSNRRFSAHSSFSKSTLTGTTNAVKLLHQVNPGTLFSQELKCRNLGKKIRKHEQNPREKQISLLIYQRSKYVKYCVEPISFFQYSRLHSVMSSIFRDFRLFGSRVKTRLYKSRS